jgi:hypothetical protein
MLNVSTFAFLLIKILRLSLFALGISLLEDHFSFRVIFGLRHLQDDTWPSYFGWSLDIFAVNRTSTFARIHVWRFLFCLYLVGAPSLLNLRTRRRLQYVKLASFKSIAVLKTTCFPSNQSPHIACIFRLND